MTRRRWWIVVGGACVVVVLALALPKEFAPAYFEELRATWAGRTRGEVVERLGPPDRETVFDVATESTPTRGNRGSVRFAVEEARRATGLQPSEAATLGTAIEMMWFDGGRYTYLYLYDLGQGPVVVDGLSYDEGVVIG